MQDFRRLRVWQASHRVTLTIYQITRRFPGSEAFGITAQLRRSASSIGANIAEGCGRGSNADTGRYFQIALGSACETLNHMLLARDLGLLDAEAFATVERELLPVRRMLIALIQRLRRARA